MEPGSPRSFLPSLSNMTIHSRSTMVAALINIRALYWPSSLIGAAMRVGKSDVQEHVYPDSGYASAEEEEETLEERLSLLRSNPLERAFVVRWLTGFIARAQEWVDDHDPWQSVVEEAAALLAQAADTHADGALTREFSFTTSDHGRISVELKDESYSADHESVGLQTWGSASILAEKMCADPATYLKLDGVRKTIRILELGAGTGLLSMVLGKLQSSPFIRDRNIRLDIVATDYHPAVLKNLRENVARNFSVNTIHVATLDWAAPPLLDEVEKYDIIFAADVIYHQQHAPWIKACAEQMLRRHGTMWMIIPCRPTHTGELNSVDDIFAGIGSNTITIVKNESTPRHPGIGRADEDGYRLFEIGWGTNC